MGLTADMIGGLATGGTDSCPHEAVTIGSDANTAMTPALWQRATSSTEPVGSASEPPTR